MTVSRTLLASVCTMFVIGCSTHEGNFGAEPDKATPPVAPSVTPEPDKPVQFRYAPDKAEYKYAVLTTKTAVGGKSDNYELDFTVKVGRKGDKITNDTTVEAILDGGVPEPGSAEKIKAFHIATVLDAHGKVLSSKATGEQGLIPPGVSSVALPSAPIKQGSTWIERVKSASGAFETSYTFTSIERVGKQRIATFEKQPTDDVLVHSLKPTIIKIDADTGVLLDKLSDLTFSDRKTNEPVMTAHIEMKLK